MLNLPFARFLQLVQVVEEAEAQEETGRYRELAFVGFQGYLIAPKAEGVTTLRWEEWLKALGLGTPEDDVAAMSDEDKRGRADAILTHVTQVVAADTERFARQAKRRGRANARNDRGVPHSGERGHQQSAGDG